MRRSLFSAAAGLVAVAAIAVGQAANDADFARKAASSGIKEVRVSEHAAQSAANAEVKEFASMLVRDHTNANEKLMAAAQSMNVTVPTELLPEHRAEQQKLTGMSGADLDRAWVDAMVASHQKSITLFEAEANNGTGALKEFAASTLPTLREHLRMAQDLQREVSTGTGATAATTDTTGTTGTTEMRQDTAAATTGTTAGTTDTEMPATASRYPTVLLAGVGLAILGLALRFKS